MDVEDWTFLAAVAIVILGPIAALVTLGIVEMLTTAAACPPDGAAPR